MLKGCGTQLTDYASGEPAVSANLFDVLHVAEELAEVWFRVDCGRVGGSHTVWVTRELRDIKFWTRHTNAGMK